MNRITTTQYRLDIYVVFFILEQKRDELLAKAKRRSTALSWFGLALMGAQFGVLARLTWWEYSWDIMEPVTYFITYGTTIAMYAYFVLTRQVCYFYFSITAISEYRFCVLKQSYIVL